VTWTRTSGVEPSDHLSTVLAYTTGVDSFVEITNGVGADGRFSTGDIIISHSEVFYDLNNNRSYDASTETYNDHNKNGGFDAAGTLDYRGVDCDDLALVANHCTETSAQIWDQIQLGYGDFPATPTAFLTTTGVSTTTWTVDNVYQVQVADINGMYPPYGTKLNVTNLGDTDAEIHLLNSVPAIGNALFTPFTYNIRVDKVTVPGFVEIQAEFPNGDTSSLIIEVQ